MKFILMFMFIFSFLHSDDAKSLNEFILGKSIDEHVSKNSYFNKLGIPNVYVTTKCPKEGDCWDVIKNQSGKTLKSFSPNDNVREISSGRYKDIAYLYYAYTYGSKKDRKTSYYLVDQNYKTYQTPLRYGGSTLTNIITKQRDIIEVSENGVYKNSNKILSNEQIDTTKISNNPNGDIAIVAVLDISDEVIVSNLKEWKSTNIMLSKHGDRKGILSVYPKDNQNIYTAVYKNINIYNKGLMGAHVDFSNNTVKTGWLFNSAERNVGFDPSMYISGSTLHLGATDSTNRGDVHIITTSQEYIALGEKTPKHIDGFEKESIIDLLVGVGISQTNWIASSSIKDISSDVEYGEVKYDIGKSLYKSIYFEGRFDFMHLSVAYLQNEAEDVGGLAGKASKILNFLVDFDGFIGDSTTLRLKALKGNINGIATFVDNNNGSKAITSTGQIEEFQSQLLTYGAYLMMQRGWFAGLEYTEYTTPSAIGFSDDAKKVVYYGMDPNFEIDTYSFVLGYDEISYAKRYEVDLSRFYFQGMAGIGWADYTLSSEAQALIKAKEPNKTINYTGSFTYKAEAEFGYIFQQRFKVARGLGYSFTAGYRARLAGNTSGQAKDDGKNDTHIDKNELELEMSRYDIWHGPYLSANLIF